VSEDSDCLIRTKESEWHFEVSVTFSLSTANILQSLQTTMICLL